MKMNTRQFKALIKECMKELIEEGAFHKMLAESFGPQVAPNQHPNFQPSQPTPYQAGFQAGYQPPNLQGFQPNNPIENAVNTLAWDMSKGDPAHANMMAHLLADTALNTMPQQDTRDPARMARAMAPMVSHMPQQPGPVGQPQMLGERSGTNHPGNPQPGQPPISRWAQIAFAKSPKR